MDKSIRAADRISKTVFHLDSPYTSVQWCLSPIGQYRADHISPSKGKRDRKRKRRENASAPSSSEDVAMPGPPSEPSEPSEQSSHFTIGLNSTTRHLETLSRASAHPPPKDPTPTPLAAIFFLRTPTSNLLHGHLPLLATTASLSLPPHLQTLLVPLHPKPAEARLCAALNLPRVSVLGILASAPFATALLAYVREHVPPTRVPWLEQAREGRYRPVEIKVVRTTAPARGTVKEKRVKGKGGRRRRGVKGKRIESAGGEAVQAT
ncbi:MAG: hypothetical protein M1832_000285 [Thelocarpon impressellum]|nr:MAG: hypothetical protein M1832_000285 [Thelocarpon impressellum]